MKRENISYTKISRSTVVYGLYKCAATSKNLISSPRPPPPSYNSDSETSNEAPSLHIDSACHPPEVDANSCP